MREEIGALEIFIVVLGVIVLSIVSVNCYLLYTTRPHDPTLLTLQECIERCKGGGAADAN